MLERGIIVTIRMPGSNYDDREGYIVYQIPGTQEYAVQLGPYDEYLLSLCPTKEEKKTKFKESELIPIDHWSPENTATLLFGLDKFYRIYFFTHNFVPGEQCAYNGCKKSSTKRIMVNIKGCVIQYDFCENHAKQYHGKCIDKFPYEK